MLSALLAALVAPSVAAAGKLPAALDCPRVDGLIRNGAGPWVGNDIYNETGAQQQRSGTAAPGSTIKFRISIQNEDYAHSACGTTRFLVKATGSTTSAYGVKYYAGSTDITSAVLGGTYKTPQVAPGSTYLITALVKVKPSAPEGSKVTRLVTIGCESWDLDWCIDAVKFTGRRG